MYKISIKLPQVALINCVAFLCFLSATVDINQILAFDSNFLELRICLRGFPLKGDPNFCDDKGLGEGSESVMTHFCILKCNVRN